MTSRLLETLRREHALIERVAGSLVTIAGPAGDPDALESACAFLAAYVDAHHHAKEERILFPALRAAGLPESGPLAVLRDEHAEGRALVAAMRAAVRRHEPASAAVLARRYCARLWEHIDKEESVLFPEVQVRLRHEHAELEEALDALEARADLSLLRTGMSLVDRFPPVLELPGGVMRGAGCVMCHRYGNGCEGVEREWWTEEEWDTFWARDA